jgi:hypothetical protein
MDIDGVNKVSGGTMYASATQITQLHKKSGDGTTWDEAIDTLFIRKCVSSEPTHGAWGNEEIPISIPTLTTEDATSIGRD